MEAEGTGKAENTTAGFLAQDAKHVTLEGYKILIYFMLDRGIV